MIIAAEYPFNGGESLKETHSHLLQEITDIITSVDASQYKTKTSEEITMPGKILYSPQDLNDAFERGFVKQGWRKKVRINCSYPTKYYSPGYSPKPMNRGAYREIDFLKDRLCVEVQFGKYAFMVYNVCAKMTIFRNLNYIDAGIEIVPVKSFADEMSSGVSYFEQIAWDLEKRGVADIDIPVLILGIDVGDGNGKIMEDDSLMQLSLDFGDYSE
ncbi:restriction endonuclease [Candidatus Poribacteria bacterium]|nr:restriction endonuclease [Candidatus Poribacteria bacterium]